MGDTRTGALLRELWKFQAEGLDSVKVKSMFTQWKDKHFREHPEFLRFRLCLGKWVENVERIMLAIFETAKRVVPDGQRRVRLGSMPLDWQSCLLSRRRRLSDSDVHATHA